MQSLNHDGALCITANHRARHTFMQSRRLPARAGGQQCKTHQAFRLALQWDLAEFPKIKHP